MAKLKGEYDKSLQDSKANSDKFKKHIIDLKAQTSEVDKQKV